MQQPDINEVAEVLAKVLYCGDRELGLCILRLLANGRPISSEQLAVSLGRSHDEVTVALRQLPNVEFDRQGEIVGSGLSLLPTSHRFEVNGHMLYTWCALDTLMYPLILKLPAHVASPCPVTGEQVRLMVMPDGIRNLTPSEAVVSIVLPQQAEACRDVRGAFCNQVHFFSSRDGASSWLEQHPTALLLSVDEAFQLGRMVVLRRYSDVLGG